MTAQNLARSLIEEYHRARKPHAPREGLYRGENRSISGIAEDLVSLAILDGLPAGYSILINQSMLCDRERFKPDICLIKDSFIVGICDVKMDLGYIRDAFIPWLRRWNQRLGWIRGKPAKFKYKKENNFRKESDLKFSDSVRLHVLVVSGGNASRNHLNVIQEKVEDCANCSYYVFSPSGHLNSYDETSESLIAAVEPRKQEFTAFIERMTGG